MQTYYYNYIIFFKFEQINMYYYYENINMAYYNIGIMQSMPYKVDPICEQKHVGSPHMRVAPSIFVIDVII